MKIGVLGLGYVGVASPACLAKAGHEIIGIDSEAGKVDLINSRHSPIVERDIAGIIQEQVSCGRLRATTDMTDAGVDDGLNHACVIVIGNGSAEFADVPKRLEFGQAIVDFVRIRDARSIAGVYEAILLVSRDRRAVV